MEKVPLANNLSRTFSFGRIFLVGPFGFSLKFEGVCRFCYLVMFWPWRGDVVTTEIKRKTYQGEIPSYLSILVRGYRKVEITSSHGEPDRQAHGSRDH